LTEALLALEAAAEDEQAVMVTLTDVAGRLAQIQSVLERFQPMNLVSVQPKDDIPEHAVLAESFVLSVKNAAKPGLGLDS
jgi:hypothetical protein